jgi:hypothetical protein
MAAIQRRGLCPDFLNDLHKGHLAALRDRVLQDRSLCLELRADAINVYYRGGSVMRVSRAEGDYSAFFDVRYFRDPPPSIHATLPSRLGTEADVGRWLDALPALKQAMDLWFGDHPKEEREVQQLIVRDNNFGGLARSTDHYVCDIEYANRHGRFDLVAVRWPSTPSARKKQDGHRLVLGEVKFGDDALEGSAGLHAHIEAVNAFLAAPGNLAAVKAEMLGVFNQKRRLGLIDCGKDLTGFSDEPPVLLLVLVNHDPGKSRLRELLVKLPPSPHAELRIATGSLLGYGLYDPAILMIDEALARFKTCI